MERFTVISGSYTPQLTNSRSATRRGLARYRFMNRTTGSNAGPPPWWFPMSVKTNDPDCNSRDPYTSGYR